MDDQAQEMVGKDTLFRHWYVKVLLVDPVVALRPCTDEKLSLNWGAT